MNSFFTRSGRMWHSRPGCVSRGVLKRVRCFRRDDTFNQITGGTPVPRSSRVCLDARGPSVHAVEVEELNFNRAGYSLLELLVYVAVFAVAVNLFVSLLGTGSQLSALNTLSMSRMEGVREVQEEFTEFTRRASAVVSEVGEYKTGADRLVLKMPQAQEGEFDYAVLGVLRESNRFAVMGLTEKEGAMEVVYMKTLRQPLETLEFDVNQGGARPLVNLRVKVLGEEGERKQPFVEHFASATPRGVGG